ncbi:hypothetical protein HNQ91_002829 [Filimonas zeae]|nr:carboxypeptidase regulatory-like domain-containing protein [Filimonas zeae]MDR6339764.1 hypothetical protein [Filimonas zeae]
MIVQQLCKRMGMLFALLLAFTASFSQETTGSIGGTVSDENKKPLAGATITALHIPSGTRYSVVADKNGYYFLNNLKPGSPYTLTAVLLGKAEEKRENLAVTLGGNQQLDLQLKDAVKQLENIVVATRATRNQADGYGAGKNISIAQVRNTPTVSRSITDITRLTPQATKDNSFGGTNFRYNNVTIDGAINNDAIGFSPSLGGQTGTSGMAGSSTRTNPISLDAIETMQIYLAPYDVKIGNFTGGSVNAVTRSGSNTVTGSVYGYGRNATITGKDKTGQLGKMKSDFHDYQAGFRVGFPILKNKLFFFTNAEITERKDPAQLVAGTPETAHILSVADANTISDAVKGRYGAIFDAGTAGDFLNWSKSQKFFNRADWNINDRHQLSVRNNTIFSKASHMDRDQQDFRFSSMAFEQENNQSSTVAELKSKLSNRVTSNVVAGFTVVNDRRNPLSDPSLPQVQIMGRTPGTTIYLGTDREASIFNMKQQTWEFTANVNVNLGKHKLLIGTHNELYKIRYGFVNGWNGRVDYLSIEDFVNNNPYRVRGSYHYGDNSRDYLLNNPAASFKVNMYSLYIQDEIRLSDKLQVVPGLRADMTHLPTMPSLTEKVQDVWADPDFGNTYTYTPLKRLNNRFLNKPQISPRVGFRYNILGDQSLVLRGGVGVFTGRIPFAWLAYAYYNTGNTFGAFDQRADQKPFAPGSDAIRPNSNGIAGFVAQNGTVTNNPNSGKTQVDLVDNNFVLPKVMRGSVALDYTTLSGWKMSVEGMYTKTMKDVLFQQLNTRDQANWYGYDRNHQHPVYSGTVDARFSNIYLLSNTSEGYRYSLTASANRTFKAWNVSLAYTYGQSKDLSNGVRNSMESNWQLNQALIPNNPGLANSNFDIRHRVVGNISYTMQWKESGRTNISLLLSAQSGSPFTYGIVNNSIQGLSQQVSLAYIPLKDEAIRYFKDEAFATAAQQAENFNQFIDGNKYLSGRRGRFTERNMARTPWNVQADLHLAHDLFISKNKARYITITVDIMNLTNLLYKEWGIQYFSPNTFNSTSSVGLTPSLFPPKQNEGEYPVFNFSNPGKPYSIDYFSSRAQGQLGVRYTF